MWLCHNATVIMVLAVLERTELSDAKKQLHTTLLSCHSPIWEPINSTPEADTLDKNNDPQKYDLWNSSMSVPKCNSGNLLDIQVLGPLQAYWTRNPRWGPEICVLTSPPGNSDADWLKILPLEKFLFICSDTRTFDQIVLIAPLFLSLPPSYTLSHPLICTHTYTHLILKTNVHCQENG